MVVSKYPKVIKLLSVFFLIVLVLFIVWERFLHKSIVNNENGAQYTVTSGASMKSVVNDLYALHIIQQPRLFSLLVYFKGNKHELKAGEYLFPKGTTPLSLLNQITAGTGMIYHSFTLIAGWNFRHLREALNREAYLEHTTTYLSNPEIMSNLGYPNLNPEGWFYPETYYFVKGSSDLEILKRALRLMKKKLNEVWKTRNTTLPYRTQEDALTVASLVEKETGLDAERPIIAGVIVNRLKANMALQIDPTVIYAIGSRYNGVIYKADLASTNPYNTYLHKGLPPTPIAFPGLVSIQAALRPAAHNYYYFVAKNRNPFSGHTFSATLSEHNQAVIKSKRIIPQLEYFNENLIRAYFLKFYTFNAE